MEFCMKCGEALGASFAFCEACGAPVKAAGQSAQAAAYSQLASNTPVYENIRRCQCGSTAFDADGFCESCGRRETPLDLIDISTIGDSAAAASHRGRRHPDNQDAVGMLDVPGGIAIAVADGVSSSWCARDAADTAVREALAVLRDVQSMPARERIAHAVEQAHRAICRIEYTVGGDLAEPQTTLVLALIEGDRLWYAWVGDSRLYLLGNTRCVQLTEDDSWLNEQLRAGIPFSSAAKDENAHSIMQSLGMRDETPHVHVGNIPLSAGAWLLLCSDGLWNYLEDADALWRQVSGRGDDAALADRCVRLIDCANRAGGQDNITVALYRHLVAIPAPAVAAPFRR